MHLARLGLRGFKSFPDPVELRFEPGVAILVGPNGSGKSNVADGIVWASGSLSPTELRAEKPDDVLFAGAGERVPAAFCEVELQFEGADGVGGLDFSTLAIARRLHRGGEGQYLVNGASVSSSSSPGSGSAARSSAKAESRRSSPAGRRSCARSSRTRPASASSSAAAIAPS